MFRFSRSSCCHGFQVRKWHKWAIIALVLIFPFFFTARSDYYDPRSLKALWNLGHLLFFALLVLVLDSYWCARRRSTFYRILAVFSTSVGLGLCIELIQLHIAGRTCSFADVITDLSGGALVLLWTIGRKLPPGRLILSGLTLITILVLNLVPIGTALTDEYRSYREFPLLAGFESETELSRWEGGSGRLSLVSSPRTQGSHSAKIVLTTDKYSGIILQHFQPDWSGRRALAFDVFNPGQPITLHYRVHDVRHIDNQKYTDRYNGHTDLKYGWNEIVIPLAEIIEAPHGRKMDITRISGFGIFVVQQADQRVLFLDNVRLL